MDIENGRADEQVKELVDKILAEEERAGAQESSYVMEFSFGDTASNNALVFESGDDGEDLPEEEPLVAPIAPVAEPEVPVAVEEEPRSVKDEEFEIPDVFAIAEAEELPPQDDGSSLIWKTYVPRFTEVTERTYRLRSDAAPVAKVENAAEAAKTTVKVNKIDPELSVGATVSYAATATAEIGEDKAVEGVTVSVNGKQTGISDSINVFKFADRSEEDKPVRTDEEIELEGINALIGKTAEPSVEQIGEQSLEEELVVESEDAVLDEPSSVDFDSDLGTEETVHAQEQSYESEAPEGAGAPYAPHELRDTAEFKSTAMREHFKDRFLDTLLSTKIRMIMAALLSLVALAFENLAIFGIDVCEMLGISGSLSAPALLDGCIVLALFALAVPEVIRAVRMLARKSVSPELSVLVSALIIVLYTVVIATDPASSYPLFGFVYSITVLSAVFSTYCLQSANFDAFKLISENDKKIVFDNRLTRTLDRENIALDGVVDEFDSRTARSFETTFVSEFVARSSRSLENAKNNLIILALALGVGVVTGGVMFFIADGLTSALSALALTVMIALPAFSALSHKLPFRNAQSECLRSDSAIIGEATCEDYSGVDVIAFEDVEIFGVEDVVLKSISLSESSGDFRRVMSRMTSLFASLGGPLHEMFKASVGKSYEPATSVTVEEDGASGIIDGEMVSAGTREYMERHGVALPYDPPSIASTKTMYAAKDGELFAKFSIQYSFSEEFAVLLSTLRERGIVPLVYTRDPNVTNELLRFLGGADVIRAMRICSPLPEKKRVYSRISSGMVTLADKPRAINLILVAKRYERLQRNVALTELSACAVGAALAAAISVCNMTLSLPSVLLGAWQLAWCAVLAVISARTFAAQKKKKRKNK